MKTLDLKLKSPDNWIGDYSCRVLFQAEDTRRYFRRENWPSGLVVSAFLLLLSRAALSQALNNSGNVLVIAATASIVVALTWAGIQHPWSSAQVLVPLILGLVGLTGFFLYEAFVAKHPIVRPSL